MCGCNVQGQVVDPVTEAPPAVRRQQKPDSLCVMFFGGPADKVRPGPWLTAWCSLRHHLTPLKM